MAFKKTYRKKTYRKKRYPRKTGTNWASIAKTALKTAKWVAGIINAEFKYNLASASLVTPTWNGTVNTLCDPIQGNGVDQREGDSIKMKDIVVRGVIDYNTLGVAEMIRVIIFIDKQNTITTASQLLQTVGVYLATESEKNEDNKFNTKTLYDKTFMVSANKPQTKFKWVSKLGFHTHFNKGSATINTNALKICYISQNPTYSAKYSHIIRCGYVDN